MPCTLAPRTDILASEAGPRTDIIATVTACCSRLLPFLIALVCCSCLLLLLAARSCCSCLLLLLVALACCFCLLIFLVARACCSCWLLLLAALFARACCSCLLLFTQLSICTVHPGIIFPFTINCKLQDVMRVLHTIEENKATISMNILCLQ